MGINGLINLHCFNGVLFTLRLIQTMQLYSMEHCSQTIIGPGARSIRFIYVREIKRLDPFKFSIYAWCIEIAIAGSLAPVRLAWVPFLRVPKNEFIYVEADTKKLYAGL